MGIEDNKQVIQQYFDEVLDGNHYSKLDGMQVEQVEKLKELEKEYARLKKLVADLSLDNAILKEVLEGNF